MKKFHLRNVLLLCIMLLTVVLLSACGKKTTDNPQTTTQSPQHTLATDYTVPNFPDTGLYINYSANSSIAGTIENGGTHRVDTSPVGTVKAVPNLGYRFVKWSDGSTDPVRTGDTTKESKQILAIFDYETLELPILCIDTETGGDVESKTEYIGATLTVFNSDSDHFIESLDMEIRGRGNKTWEYEKKSYKMKLSEKQSLLGLGEGKAKKWVLLANVCDQSLLRNHLSLLLAGNMPSIAWSPASTSVDVYLNGEYRGVYLLCEEIDVNANKIAIPEDVTGAGADIGFLVEISGNPKEPNFRAAERTYQIHNDLSTNEAEAKQQQSYITSFVQTAWSAVTSGDEAQVSQIIDIDSMVDAYLVEEITKNLDCGYDSFYLYRTPGGKLTFGPVWDFDNALGNADEGTQYSENLYVAYNERFQSNPWFYTIIGQDWFRQRVTERWDEITNVRAKLSSTILTAGKAGYKSYCRNFDRWDLFGQTWNRETEQITSLMTYTEHYEFLASWIDERLAWLDNFYHSDDFLKNWTGETPNIPAPNPGWPEWPDWPDHPDIPDQPIISEGIGNEAAKELSESHSQLKVLPQSVTSTATGFPSEGVDCLFDLDFYTKYCVEIGQGGGWWGTPTTPGTVEITFALESPAFLSGYQFVTANDTSTFPERNPNSWILYGKGEDGSYVEIDASSSTELGMGAHNYTAYGKLLTDVAAYSEYKLVITHAGTLQLAELNLFTK